MRASRIKNVAIEKKTCEDGAKAPKTCFWKGQLDAGQPSASASRRKHRGGLPGYSPGVKGGEWSEAGKGKP